MHPGAAEADAVAVERTSYVCWDSGEDRVPNNLLLLGHGDDGELGRADDVAVDLGIDLAVLQHRVPDPFSPHPHLVKGRAVVDHQ